MVAVDTLSIVVFLVLTTAVSFSVVNFFSLYPKLKSVVFSTNSYGDSVIVPVNEGHLKGRLLNVSTGLGSYYSFKGIPYAEPPIGALRFKDPIPHKPWEGVRDATEHGERCIQYSVLLPFYISGDEDCLFLNVYTPNLKPKKPLAVLFFIHGGAFFFGSGEENAYGPDFLTPKNVVVVTINYRLDALGFLNLGTKEVPGNAGLKDQLMALKWVHNNIHNFGGDPNEITIMGQSAGSAAVTYHMMSHLSRGLFKRAIAMSGVPFCEWAITYKLTERSFELGRTLGADTHDPDEMLEFLQSRPASEVIRHFPVVIPEEHAWYPAIKMTAFQPAPEKDFGQERFLVEPAIETLKKRDIAPVDVLMGYTSTEYMTLLPVILITDILKRYNEHRDLLVPHEITLYGNHSNTKELTNKIQKHYFGNRNIDFTTVDRWVKYKTDLVFIYNVNRFIKYLPAFNKKYLYKFNTVTERNLFNPFGVPFGITGLAHTEDLNYIFDSKTVGGKYPVDVNSDTFKAIDQTVTLFTNFAKYGNPTPDYSLGVIWPEYDNFFKEYLIIDKKLKPAYLDGDAHDFWRKIYEKGGVELA